MVLVTLVGCRQSGKVSYNVSKEADNFNVVRRVTVINTRTDKIEFEAIGNIAIEVNSDSDGNKEIVAIAEVAKGNYKKHFISLTPNNMYVVEDLDGVAVSEYRYEVNYMPESIIPITITESK